MEPAAIARLFHEQGWREQALVTAVAVCLGESEGNEFAHNDNPSTGDDSYGLLQINMRGSLGPDRRKRYGLSSNADLFKPEVNAMVGFDIYRSAGHRFAPWGAYTSGGYRKYGRYQKAQEAVDQMARSVKSLLKLLAEVNALAPNRSKASDGWIGDPAHAARSSQHNPDGDSTVDARDITHDPANDCDIEDIFGRIVKKKDRRVRNLIWNRRILAGNSGPSPWVWREYNGSNPHTKHGHIDVLDQFQDDESPWLEEGLMIVVSREEFDALREKVDAIWTAVYEKVDGKTIEATDQLRTKLDEILTEIRKP